VQIFHYYSTPALLAVALLLGVLASLIVLIARKRRELKVPDNRQVIVGSLGLAGGLFTLGMFIGERTGSISGNTLITLEVAVAVAAVTFANVKPWEPPVPGAISWPCER
jgi:drug/metabolite transporter (DMT)-like permease